MNGYSEKKMKEVFRDDENKRHSKNIQSHKEKRYAEQHRWTCHCNE